MGSSTGYGHVFFENRHATGAEHSIGLAYRRRGSPREWRMSMPTTMSKVESSYSSFSATMGRNARAVPQGVAALARSLGDGNVLQREIETLGLILPGGRSWIAARLRCRSQNPAPRLPRAQVAVAAPTHKHANRGSTGDSWGLSTGEKSTDSSALAAGHTRCSTGLRVAVWRVRPMCDTHISIVPTRNHRTRRTPEPQYALVHEQRSPCPGFPPSARHPETAPPPNDFIGALHRTLPEQNRL